ncbi:MAG: hypothetical protein P8J86_09915 [Phycisphaerales bacterium]|nr:hypothetical protein [Phycisphaerales bacterium]
MEVRFRASESRGVTEKTCQSQRASSDQDMTSEASVRRFWRRCRLALESKPSVLVIDLAEVVRADTKLIACLAGLYQLGRDEHVAIEVHASAAVLTVARICHLEPLLEIMSPAPSSDAAPPPELALGDLNKLTSPAL